MKKLFLTLLVLLCAIAQVNAEDVITWTVAGTAAALNGTTDWAPANTDNDMNLVSGTTYQLTVTNCTLEADVTYAYKVVKNHAWGEDYPASNKTFTVNETAIYTVVYTFDSDTKAVSEEVTKTGEAGDIVHTYNIAGNSVALFGAEWDETNTATDMSYDDVKKIYTWENSDVALTAGNIEFKVTQDHAWGVSYPAENFTLNIPSDGTYKVTITFNEDSKAVSATAIKKNTYTVTFVNGEEWTEVAAYVWNGDGGSAVKIEGEWPGKQIYSTGTYTYKGNNYDVYTYTLETYDDAPEKIIFNNNKAGDSPEKEQTTTLTFTDGKQYRYGLPAGKYVLAGSNNTIFPSGWTAENSTQELTDNGDGTYSYTLSNIDLNANDLFEFKVVDIANSVLVYYPSADNVSYKVYDKATYDFDITFDTNPETPTVGVTGKRQVVIDAAGFTSFSSGHDLDWSAVENAAPYMATLTGEAGYRKALLSKVTATEAGQGALIKGTPNATVKPIIKDVTNSFKGNLFVATNGTAISASTDGSYNYVYSSKDKLGNDNPGFYKLTSNLAEGKVKAYGAYLQTTEPLAEEAASRVSWIFDDEVTGINQIENTQPATVKNTVVYNLNGQRVMNPAKGLYIVNGKKVIIK